MTHSPMTNPLPDFRKLYETGLSLLQAGQRDEALKHFVTAIQARPDLAEAWWQAALIFIDAHLFPKALHHAARAVELRPEEPTVWATWADAVALSGDAAAERAFLDKLRKARIAPAIRLRLQDRFGAERKGGKGAVGRAPRARLDAIAKLIAAARFDRAEVEATLLLRDAPDSAVACNMLGVAMAAQGKAEAALAQFKAAIRIDPFFADPFFNLGRELANLNRRAEAERMLRAAIARAPAFASALMLFADLLMQDLRSRDALPFLRRVAAMPNAPAQARLKLGGALNEAKEFEEAVAILRRVAESDGETIYGLTTLAEAEMALGRADDALATVDRALTLAPDHVVATGRKAMILQTLGRFDEARPLFLTVMNADPKNGAYFRSYMNSTKSAPGDPLVERMIGLIEQPGINPRSEMNFGFAIAKGLEDQKDHARAFTYLRRANDIVCCLTPYDHSARLAEVAKLQDAFRGHDWAGHRVADASDAAPIFITGMPRSGTTLIEQIIASHSRVTGGDELDFLPKLASGRLFNDPLSPMARRISAIPDPEIAALGRDYIAMVAERFPGADIVTDKSITSYMYLGLVKLALPNARFIIVRRDPRDTLLSIYKNRFPEGTHLYAYDLRALAHHYATFVDMIDFWRAETPGWFTEVQYENLVANPEDESRRLIAACGLDWQEACLNFHNNERQVRTLSVYQVRQPISGGSVKAWQRYEKELAPMIEVLAERGLLPD
jgi:tetratricopeptide (TPR) repeat protein